MQIVSCVWDRGNGVQVCVCVCVCLLRQAADEMYMQEIW